MIAVSLQPRVRYVLQVSVCNSPLNDKIIQSLCRSSVLSLQFLFYLHALSLREHQLVLLDSNMFLWTARFPEYTIYRQGSVDWEIIRSINLGIVSQCGQATRSPVVVAPDARAQVL